MDGSVGPADWTAFGKFSVHANSLPFCLPLTSPQVPRDESAAMRPWLERLGPRKVQLSRVRFYRFSPRDVLYDPTTNEPGRLQLRFATDSDATRFVDLLEDLVSLDAPDEAMVEDGDENEICDRTGFEGSGQYAWPCFPQVPRERTRCYVIYLTEELMEGNVLRDFASTYGELFDFHIDRQEVGVPSLGPLLGLWTLIQHIAMCCH